MTITIHPRVLELLASKICHDLVSPVGAVSNGIELMRELGPEMSGDAVDLIESSILQASVRLKMFRLVYGAAGSEKMVSLTDIKETFENWAKGGRNTVSWVGEIDLDDVPKGFAKTLLNILMLAIECNPGDGEIITEFSTNSAKIIVNGKKPALYDGMDKCLKLDFPIEDLDPRLVHAYVAAVFADYFGLNIAWENISESQLNFTLSCKNMADSKDI